MQPYHIASSRYRLWFFRVLSLGICSGIFFLSSFSVLPGPESNSLDFFYKKLAHMSVYALLYFCFVESMPVRMPHRQKYMLAFVFGIMYAISDEVHQSLVPGRTARLRDVGYDMIGMTGMWLKMKSLM